MSRTIKNRSYGDAVDGFAFEEGGDVPVGFVGLPVVVAGTVVNDVAAQMFKRLKRYQGKYLEKNTCIKMFILMRHIFGTNAFFNKRDIFYL